MFHKNINQIRFSTESVISAFIISFIAYSYAYFKGFEYYLKFDIIKFLNIDDHLRKGMDIVNILFFLYIIFLIVLFRKFPKHIESRCKSLKKQYHFNFWKDLYKYFKSGNFKLKVYIKYKVLAGLYDIIEIPLILLSISALFNLQEYASKSYEPYYHGWDALLSVKLLIVVIWTLIARYPIKWAKLSYNNYIILMLFVVVIPIRLYLAFDTGYRDAKYRYNIRAESSIYQAEKEAIYTGRVLLILNNYTFLKDKADSIHIFSNDNIAQIIHPYKRDFKKKSR
jgi:hypothetical protein